MGGGLMQLVAYGAQDVYLTGNPQITFFKVVYRRHTNFSCECIELTFSGSPGFGKTVTSTISRNGDLITKMYLKVVLPEKTVSGKYALCKNFGFAVIDNVTCEIGGTQVDKQYGDWMFIWNELAGDRHTQGGLDRMIGNTNALTTFTNSKPQTTLYVPLYFWFCRNNGLALPLIALQYHEVKVKVQFQDRDSVVMTDNQSSSAMSSYEIEDATLLVDYIYLDTEERKRFAQASHEYLIEQLQYTGAETMVSGSNKVRLNFNHPCKFLVWGVKTEDNTAGQKVTWSNDPETLRDQFARTIALLKVKHAANGETEETVEGSGEAGLVPDEKLFPGVFSAMADKVDAIVAHDDTTKSSIDQVALTRNDLSAADVSMSKSALETAHNIFLGAASAGHAHIFTNHVNFRNPLAFSQYADGSGNPLTSCKLQLNGHDRFSERDGNSQKYDRKRDTKNINT